MTGALLRTALALGIVLVVIGAAAFAYRKKRPGAAGPVSLVSYLPLGPRKGVATLKVGRELLVVGVTGTDLRLLASLPEGEAGGHAERISGAVDRLREIRKRLDG